jgi:rhodanese-related sulfurtransferase
MIPTQIPQISADEVHEAINKKADIVLLDVRTLGDYKKGRIEGSINIPVDEIQNKGGSLLPDKEKNIYVYCLSGSRSDYAASALIQMGYVNVFSMTSGLLMWRAKKYSLLNSS